MRSTQINHVHAEREGGRERNEDSDVEGDSTCKREWDVADQDDFWCVEGLSDQSYRGDRGAALTLIRPE